MSISTASKKKNKSFEKKEKKTSNLPEKKKTEYLLTFEK